MSASVLTHQVIQLLGFPIFRRVTHLTGQPRFALLSPCSPSASSRRSVARPALAYGFPSRWLGGEGFFQPSGSADMPGTQQTVPLGATPLYADPSLMIFHQMFRRCPIDRRFSVGLCLNVGICMLGLLFHVGSDDDVAHHARQIVSADIAKNRENAFFGERVAECFSGAERR